MWQLKYEYKHSDCLYTGKSERLNVTVSTYPLTHFFKNKKFYLTAIHILDGKDENIQKYISYLKKLAKNSEKITDNIIFTLVEVKRNVNYYKAFYNPSIIYSTPIIHKGGKEHIQIASWDRSLLAEILSALQKNKNTKLLKILSFKEEKIKDIFLMRAVPKLTTKQRNVFESAIRNGYYNYPRKVNLNQLSKILKLSKSNLHEILRRAESNILSYFL